MQRQIQTEIFEHLNKDINDFQLALEKIASSPDCLPAIAHALTGTLSLKFQEKQKLAVAINFIVSTSFRTEAKNYGLWTQYYDCIATSSTEQLEWKLMKIMEPAVVQFMESFEEEFDEIMWQSYGSLNDYHVIMVTNCIIHHDIQQDHQLHWLGRIRHDYMSLGSRILAQVRSLDQQQSITKLLEDYCLEYLFTLKQIIIFLKVNFNSGSEWKRILNDMSADSSTMQVIVGFINIDNGKGDHVEWFHSDRSMKNQVENQVKAVALQCYVALLDQYDMKSSNEVASEFPVLQFMQKQIPLAVEQISRIPPEVLQLDCNEILCSSILSLIGKGCEFEFMGEYYWQLGKFVFWRVIVPLLQLSNEEIRQYYNDPDDFFNQALSLIEDDRENTPNNPPCNLKLQTAYLLDSMCEHIYGLLTYITHEIVTVLQGGFDGNQSTQEAQKYSTKITLENCLTILNLLSYWVSKREDLLRLISEAVKGQRHRLLHLQGIDKVRFLMFLKEYYEVLMISKEEGEQYFLMAADCLTENQCTVKSALQMLNDYKYLSEAHVVWDRLVELSPTTQCSDILDLLGVILAQSVESMAAPSLMHILGIMMARVSNQFEEDMSKTCLNHRKSDIYLPNRDCVLSCLRIIREIAMKADARENSQELFGTIWPFFDMMKGFGVIEYSDEIIKVFNIVITAKRQVGEEFFQFLNFFEAYHLNEKSIGQLYETYTLLFERGKEYLKSREGQASFKIMIANILCVINFRNRQTVCEALTLLQYALLLYPQQIVHSSIFESTKRNLDNSKQPYKKDMLAHFLNLWWIGSAYSPQYRIETLFESSTSIFQGYSARVLAVALKMNVAEQCYAKDIDLLLKTLTYAVRSLDHYLTFPTENIKHTRRKLAHFAKQNPQSQIKECFRLCRQMLSEIEYEQLLRGVSCEAPIQTINQLLSYRVIESEPRKILRISHAH